AAMVADATVAGSTKAYLGFLGAATNGAHLSAGGLDVEATEGTSAAIAKILVVNISIFGVGGAGGGTDAEITRDVQSFIAPQDSVNAHNGSAKVKAISNAVASAYAVGGAGALVASLAALTINAHVGGSTLAYVGAGSTVNAGALEVTAAAARRGADATSSIVNVSVFVAGGGSSTTATVDASVNSFIGDGSLVTVANAVMVNATNSPLANANGFGANVGTGSIGATVTNANVAGTTSS